MKTVAMLLVFQGTLGAFDTVYYHELKAKLPAGGAQTRPELWLHGLRDFIYAVLFGTLAFVRWSGVWAWLLLVLIAAEIVITMADFAVEKRTRAPDDLLPGERVTHGTMAIIYGAMLGHLLPRMWQWSAGATGLFPHPEPLPSWLAYTLLFMGAGVFASGVRDIRAATRPPSA